MDKKDKDSAAQNKAESKVDALVPSELNGGLPIENNEEEDDQSGDSSTGVGEWGHGVMRLRHRLHRHHCSCLLCQEPLACLSDMFLTCLLFTDS
ncbi:hypothetical protein RIF29_31765 [Crotalaria pallida]|uniref:Uncharacterized protein n=1 Tax=Crotalaria pallida TaxID=3830 RepID=A0AAN9EIC2_CROPI